MKTPDVLHIATYESFGGAARATMRIFEALKTQALRSQMFTLVKTSSDQNIQLVQPKENHAKLEFIHKVLKLKQKLSSFLLPHLPPSFLHLSLFPRANLKTAVL